MVPHNIIANSSKSTQCNSMSAADGGGGFPLQRNAPPRLDTTEAADQRWQVHVAACQPGMRYMANRNLD